jgi:hypothetical protein
MPFTGFQQEQTLPPYIFCFRNDIGKMHDISLGKGKQKYNSAAKGAVNIGSEFRIFHFKNSVLANPSGRAV